MVRRQRSISGDVECMKVEIHGEVNQLSYFSLGELKAPQLQGLFASKQPRQSRGFAGKGINVPRIILNSPALRRKRK